MLTVRIVGGENARADPGFVSAAELGERVTFGAHLTGFPDTRRSEFGDRFWVRAAAPGASGGVPLLLWLNEAPGDDWAPGVAVRVDGKPQAFAPGDAAAFGVRVTSIERVGAADWGGWPGAVAARVRTDLAAAAERVPGAELVPGFAVGDTSLVSVHLDDAMRESSLAHLTAVSGANCALVTGAAMWLLARLGAGRRLRVAAAGLALGGFVALVGPDASVQRAAVMAAVLLLSGFGGKRAVSLPALGVAVVVLLTIDPWQAMQPGFALSVAATAGILLLADPLSRWLRRRAYLPRMLALPVAVAAAAQVACGPLLLLLQPGIPAVGVLANVVASPAVPLGTGLGLVAALTAPMFPGIAHVLLVAASLPARWVAATADLTAQLPFARWHWPDGWFGFLLLVCCQLALLLAWALQRGHVSLPGGSRAAPRAPWHPPPARPRLLRLWVTMLVCAVLGVGVGTILITPLATRFTGPAGWSMLACDIGQGDAVLVRDPAAPDHVMLVDTGADSAALLACLERFEVTRLAMLVLSHDDHDHVGALPAILDRVDVALIAPTVQGEATASRSVVRQLVAAGIPTRVGAAGDAGGLGAVDGMTAKNTGLQWAVLAPESTARPAESNAASLVLRVDVAGSSLIMLGDTGAEEQRRLRARYPQLEVDVVKVSHHGSRDQDPGLIAELAADWGIISVGAENGYGHPVPATIAEFSRAGTRILRTDRDGAVALVPQPDGSLTAWAEHGGDGRAP